MTRILGVQDHRWDVALPSLAKGDVQAAGIRIDSREAGATGPRLLLESRAPSTDDFVTLTRSVPIVLDVASGLARFTTELALTNRGTRPVTARLLYQASIGDPAGSGGTTEALGAGEQKVIPDVIAFLRKKSLPIPQGNQGGQLLVTFDGADSEEVIAATARTTTETSPPQPEGAAGLSYSGIRPARIAGGASKYEVGSFRRRATKTVMTALLPTAFRCSSASRSASPSSGTEPL